MIQKSDIINIQNNALDVALKAAEGIIDNNLQRGYYNISCNILINLLDQNLRNLSEQLISKIISTYEKGDWKVKRNKGYDQHDGDSWDSLDFS